MNNEQHELVDDAARRDRLERAMDTRAARWCAEFVLESQRSEEANGRGRARPAANIARSTASAYAEEVVRLVCIEGEDPQDGVVLNDVWRYRLLKAWSAVRHLVEHPSGVVTSTWDDAVAEIEAADAALAWQLPSERIAR